MPKSDRRPLEILETLMRALVAFEHHEDLAGDFEEMFSRISLRKGQAWAHGWYVFQLLKLTPAYVKNQVLWSAVMISNYLKTAIRNIWRNKIYSVINITGLAIGLACCILILLFIQDELSFDRFHSNAGRIFRLVDSLDIEGAQARYFALSSAPFAPALKSEFAQVEDAARILMPRRRMVTRGETKFYEDGILFADASVLQLFTFPLIKGDRETALAAPNTLVISENMRLKYFGSDDPLNERLQIDSMEFLVTGVMENIPDNSHLQADMFASMPTLERIPSLQENYFKSWARHEFYTYLLLRDGREAEELQNQLPGFIERNAAAQVRSILGSTLSSRLQPLRSIHLHSSLQYEISPNGDIKYVYIFAVIALFILLIAGVNFMNLATARSAARAREVGMRKVVGASRRQLIKQFLGESLLFTGLALVVGLVLVFIALPSFNSLTGKEITGDKLLDVILLGFLLLILLFIGFVSGSYPAFYISRFQPASVLRRSIRIRSGRSVLRKGLVILQFGISITLIIATGIVLTQLDYLRNQKLGFRKEHVVVIPIRAQSLRTNYESVKTELLQNPAVTAATVSIGVPGGVIAGDAIRLVTEEGEKTITVRMIYTDHDYIKTMGMEIVQGRDFSKDMSTDAEEAFIVNESAVRALQLEDPLQTRLHWDEKKGTVIGVVRDFQFQSLKDEITPLVIHIWPRNTYVFAVRIDSREIPRTLAFLEDTWKKLDPAHPFEFSFLDDTVDRLYRSEEKLGKVFSGFSVLAILIAALGLFGLALFMVESRAKEIGIRKVLGASIGSIFMILTREFTLLVLLANVAAWPIAYILMSRWLENFAYRIDIRVGIFLLSALAALAAALLTIGYHCLKSALSDPVKSLRYE